MNSGESLQEIMILFGFCNRQTWKISPWGVCNIKPDRATGNMIYLFNHEAWLLVAIDVRGQGRVLYDNADSNPGIGVRWRFDRMLIFIWELCTQRSPRIVRQWYVLYAPTSQDLVFFFELKWTKVYGIKGSIVFAVKSNSDKTVLFDIFPPYIKFQNTIWKFNCPLTRQLLHLHPCSTGYRNESLHWWESNFRLKTSMFLVAACLWRSMAMVFCAKDGRVTKACESNGGE